METKQELIKNISITREKLLNYVYPDCPEAKLFAKQYYDTILSTIFDNSESVFSIIYGDVNKLKEVNRLGTDVGDASLARLFQDVQSILPNGSCLSRLGGDEISILVPNCTAHFAQLIESLIHDKLDDDKELLNGLTIALFSIDSNSGDLKTLEKIADLNVEAQKHHRDYLTLKAVGNPDEFFPLVVPESDFNSEKSWTFLNTLINTAVENHLSDTRPSNNREYSTEDIRNEAFMLVHAFSDILKNYNIENDNENHKTFQLPDDYKLDGNSDKLKNPNLCKLIHSIIVNGSSSNLELLDDTQLNELNLALEELLNNVLTKDSLSGLLNKASLKYDLSNEIVESKTKYQAVYFSISGIKCSNTACGHDYTDMRIKETSKLLVDAFSKKCQFNNDTFSFNDSDNFLLDRGGGNFVALVSNKNQISQEDILSIADEVNSHYNPDDISSTFMIAHASSNDFMEDDLIQSGTIEELYNSISILKNECNNNKDEIKKQTVNNITNLTAFKNRIYNAVKFYYENISNNKEDIEKQTVFITNLFTSLINNEYYHNRYEKEDDKEIDNEIDL